MAVAFRKQTLLPLDDCLYTLQATIPSLTRSALHRCFQRHGISRLPEVEGDRPAKEKFRKYPIGYFHVDIAEVRTEQGKLIFFRVHAWACEQNSIEHRRTKPKHPWTNGQVERMNRTLKEATVKRNYYQTHQQLKEHLQTFLMAYNFAKRLKTLKGLTPYQFICQQWQKTPLKFTINPLHHSVGLNT
ncbi:hypothetical protein HDF17_002347 [Granulicella arctica]|uniref:Integrase catalytic domain-containing protein n=1 Tax=Granulicella arctica TaxID=940613 RepID=A0A7Y9PHP5_9BACT|nr:hypothetical protein [Granulicella arctica]